MRISDITPDVLFRAYVARGWKPFTEGDYNLNIIGIRADDRKSNTFNDLICLLYKTDGRWVLRKYAATTDPGLYYRQNPLNPRGTAILKDGYYRPASRAVPLPCADQAPAAVARRQQGWSARFWRKSFGGDGGHPHPPRVSLRHFKTCRQVVSRLSGDSVIS